MRELDVNDLRALIRLIAPLRALREDVEKSLHLELYSGAGDLAVRSLTALRDQVLEITQDPYIEALSLDAYAGDDREKFSQVMLISGQLLAYLEAQTGVSLAAHPGRQHYSVQTAPNVHLNMGDVVGGQAEKIMDFVESAVANAMRGIGGRGGPRPPRPPRPPEPPRPPRGERKRREDDAYDYGSGDEEMY
ncbi:MAG: hypothetical protein DIU68_010785 [Chloroflexota bacterium]|nr:MAG: hypothetical protein DIU68_15060 [Chloroflexota bacterium]